jgi:intein/homing endonuclease
MKYTEELAEIIGIMLGDGCLYKAKKGDNTYSTIITSGKNERHWINYVKNQFENYFKQSFKISEIKYGIQARNHLGIVAKHLMEAGLHHGNKINNKVEIPQWIFQKKEFLLKAVQGLFDTDGCVYNKYSNYAQIEFKFGCFETTSSVHKAVKDLGFNPTKIQKQIHSITGRSLWRFYLSRQGEIDLFFQKVKPKNQKHQLRYKKIRSGDTGIRTQICG